MIRITLVIIGLTGLPYLLACSGDVTTPPQTAPSTDFKLEPVGGANGYQPGLVWQDSTVLEVRLNRSPVPGMVVRYRATNGTITPASDTTDSEGRTTYVWRLPLTGQVSGEVFACVEASDGCTEKRQTGFNYTPGT